MMDPTFYDHLLVLVAWLVLLCLAAVSLTVLWTLLSWPVTWLIRRRRRTKTADR